MDINMLQIVILKMMFAQMCDCQSGRSYYVFDGKQRGVLDAVLEMLKSPIVGGVIYPTPDKEDIEVALEMLRDAGMDISKYK